MFVKVRRVFTVCAILFLLGLFILPSRFLHSWCAELNELCDQVLLYEVSFAADGTTAALVAFLNSLYRERPRLYFRSLTIKPAVPGSADVIAINATLCALNFTVPELSGAAAEVKP